MIRGLLVTLSIVAGVAVASVARAEWVVVPPRAGQVGLAVQGQYGTLLKKGLGDEFGHGPGLAVRLRYRMRYERAMGLSFESERFNVREETDVDTLSHHMTAFAYGIDVYQMFGTRTRTTKWVNVGVGLVQFRRTLNDDQIQFGLDNDGVYVSAGIGLERFVWQSWAIDMSAKHLTLFQEGRANYDFQAAIGLVVYATY